MEPKDTFQNRLSIALKTRNIKPVELHEKTGISESLLSKYLSGNAVARQKKLSILSDALDINPVWLMGYDVPMTNQNSSSNQLSYIIENEYGSSSIQLLNYYKNLNALGKEKAIENIKDLTEIPKYTNKDNDITNKKNNIQEA